MCPQLCLTLCCSMDGSPPGSSVHGISQARILEWVAISFSRGSSHPIYWNCISYVPALAGRFLSTGTIWEAAFIVCVKFLFIDSHWKLFFRWSKWLHWILYGLFKISVQFSSVAHSSPTPCDPMDRSMPGLPVHHQHRVYSHSRPLSWWCHPTISSAVVPFSSCLQSLPALGSFQMSQLFAWGGQSTWVSTSTSVLTMNTQDWSPLGWTGWISL